MNENNCCQVAPPIVLNQGVFNTMRLPINDDYVAVSHAISDLLKEGWKFSGLIRAKDNGLIQQDCFYIELNREWKC